MESSIEHYFSYCRSRRSSDTIDNKKTELQEFEEWCSVEEAQLARLTAQLDTVQQSPRRSALAKQSLGATF
jgi:site-specific recombinase XerD